MPKWTFKHLRLIERIIKKCSRTSQITQDDILLRKKLWISILNFDAGAEQRGENYFNNHSVCNIDSFFTAKLELSKYVQESKDNRWKNISNVKKLNK